MPYFPTYKFSEAHHQAIADSVELALGGEDFSPIRLRDASDTQDNDTFTIFSGSRRMKYRYDPEAGCFVHVAEAFILTEEEGMLEDHHRLQVWWDNGEDIEYKLDDGGCVLLEQEDVTNPGSIERKRKKIIRALEVLMSD